MTLFCLVSLEVCVDEWIDATRMDIVSTMPANLGADPFTGSNTSAVLSGENPEVCFEILGLNVFLIRIHFWAINFDSVVIQPFTDATGSTAIASEVPRC